MSTPAAAGLQAIARTTARWRLTGVAAGAVLGVVTAGQGGLGRGLLLAAPVFALCVLAGVLVGESRITPPRGPERSAALEVRRVRDYLPLSSARVAAAATGVLAAVAVATTVVGSPDDLGRAGRSLVRRCSAVMTSGAGAWPGSFYTLPLGMVVLCGLTAAWVVLVRLVRRPRRAEELELDDALRSSSARALTAAVGLLITVPLAGISVVAAGALTGISCRPAGWTVAAIVLAALAVASLGLAARCAAALVVPAHR